MVPARMRVIAEDWIAAWNAHDLDRIMRHYAEDAVLQSPTAAARFQRADGMLHGAAEIREHFRRGLELVPHLRFDLEDVFASPSGYAVLYRRENGNRVIDAVKLDEHGRARRVTVYYVSAQC